MHVVGAGLVGRTGPDHGLAADQRRAWSVFPCGRRRWRRGLLVIVAIDVRDHVPAVGLEALRRVVGEPALDVAVDGDAVVVPEAISLPRPQVPASEQASCEMPSIRQPSPRNTQVRWSTISGRAC